MTLLFGPYCGNNLAYRVVRLIPTCAGCGTAMAWRSEGVSFRSGGWYVEKADINTPALAYWCPACGPAEKERRAGAAGGTG